MPINGEDRRPLPWLRDRSRAGFEAWRRWQAEQYAVADHGGGEAEGQDGVMVPRVAFEC